MLRAACTCWDLGRLLSDDRSELRRRTPYLAGGWPVPPKSYLPPTESYVPGLVTVVGTECQLPIANCQLPTPPTQEGSDWSDAVDCGELQARASRDSRRDAHLPPRPRSNIPGVPSWHHRRHHEHRNRLQSYWTCRKRTLGTCPNRASGVVVIGAAPFGASGLLCDPGARSRSLLRAEGCAARSSISPSAFQEAMCVACSPPWLPLASAGWSPWAERKQRCQSCQGCHWQPPL
ncbi:hypothetical protein BO71DRAFT_50799 [Aspergillus ellipticus CBS 707.79]|uniref:Uncharacterized protein n=1 Tax=Aspergillus ellipticus CBS 707.79 TaxID=1448320 RepID=A0A319DWD3_9EURO|nr:hypothetical protein BO71DRAFT_50799 [Aspergillus ellipticus CBS 707.79]